jgi:hypothetical protein
MKKHGDALALLLGVSKGDKHGADGDLTDACRDMLDAIKDDDAEALAKAFERAVCACPDGDEDDSED